MTPPKYNMHLVLCLLLFCVYSVEVLAASSYGHRQESENWLNHGGGLFNRRYAEKEYKISPKTAPKLRLKWKFFAGKDITATPAIYNGTVYFPSWNGNIYAVKEDDGSLVWKQNVGNLTGLNGTGLVPNVNWTVSRATPTIAKDLLIVGLYGPGVVLGLKRTSGELVWNTTLDHHPAAVITMSGTYHQGAYYVGTSSQEESSASIKQCCIFRGSFSKLDAKSGAILWKTYVLPDNNNSIGAYAGAAIWGSSPSIDVRRNHVYIATGNLYSAPPRILECQERQKNRTKPTEPDECVEPDNHSNSILALHLDSGNIAWYRQLGGYDVWFMACNNPSVPNCPPSGPTPDADFGEAPMMLTIYNANGTKKDIVVAVQKSGFAWALDRNNGSLVWFTEAGPGGLAGGGSWGAATDEKRVYTNIVNVEGKNFTLVPSNTVTHTGGWVAMNSSTGKILWSIASPSNSTPTGPVSVANGVVFVGSPDREGSIYAINGKSGEVLWSNKTGATVYGGMSISNGCIYVGHGYRVNLGFGANLTAGTSLFAFCV